MADSLARIDNIITPVAEESDQEIIDQRQIDHFVSVAEYEAEGYFFDGPVLQGGAWVSNVVKWPSSP